MKKFNKQKRDFAADKETQNDFLAFFRDASSREKREFIRGVVRESNKDQRDLVERHNQILKTRTT